MFVSIINDCADDNARVRQEVRSSVLFKVTPSFVGVNSFSSLSAAGSIIDILDSTRGKRGVVLVNVAPRHKRSRKWKNGTPFGFFYYKKTLVCSTVDNETLSLVKRFRIADKIKVFDIKEVCDKQIKDGKISKKLAERIINTQFRSFEFLPRVANWVLKGYDVPCVEEDIEDKITDESVWWVDNFGNCKTTLIKKDIEVVDNKISTEVGEFPFYKMLRDVPDGELAVIEGSSGFKGRRFLEIVAQGKSASEELNIDIGTKVK